MDRYLKIPRSPVARVTLPDFSGGAKFDSDESVTPTTRAADCYNFDFSDGALKSGYGLEAYSAFEGYNVTAIHEYRRYNRLRNRRDDRLLAIADGKLYQYYNGSVTRVGASLTFRSTNPLFVNYRLYGEDVVLICTESDGMIVYNGVKDPYVVTTAPKVTSLTLFGERLFVTVSGEKTALWFSDDLDPTNWDASLSGGGFIEMLDERGALNRVISFLNYVYVFRDYGITRVSALGNQTDFSVAHLFVAGGKIHPGSVCVCGDSVVFLAADGLYTFDGVSARRLLTNLDGLFDETQSACASAYHDGKYYLCFRASTNVENIEINNASGDRESANDSLLVVDFSHSSYSLSRGLALIGFTALDEGALAVTATKKIGKVVRSGAVFGTPLKKRWRVPKTDLGDPRRKVVREISLASEYPVRVVLRSDERSRTILFSGGGRVERKRLAFSGRRIGYDIETDEGAAHISRPSFSVSIAESR